MITPGELGAPAIQGTGVVHDWFDGWPKFQDAEVVSLHLARQGESVIRVYPFYPGRRATIEFILSEITSLELTDFGPQNVLAGLTLNSALDATGAPVYRLQLFPLLGIGGRLNAKQIRLRLIPGPSADGYSQW